MTGGLTTVHVRVNDTASGQAVPVRLRLSDAAGRTYPPLGRLARFATGPGQDVGGNLWLDGRAWAVVEGACEIPLPGGRLTVELWRGPEYRPVRQDLDYREGKLALRLAVERWSNLAAQGWYSGDARCHDLTPHAALLEAAAEDLAVVNLLAQEEVHTEGGEAWPVLSTILAFSGQQAALERPGHLVAVNTHNRHPRLGSLGLLHCHRAVYPLAFGGPDGRDDWTLLDWCYQCHRKRGLVVWTYPRREEALAFPGEPLADLILGQVDALEVSPETPAEVLDVWYALLGLGYAVPLVGSSGKHANDRPLGAWRTYAKLKPGEMLGYREWIEAVRAGRTFATAGPLVDFRVDGCDPGAVLEVRAKGERVQVRAEARSVVTYGRLQLVADGRVIAEVRPSGDVARAVIEKDWEVRASGWLAARCVGEPEERLLAHTSPVCLKVAGLPGAGDEGARQMLVGHLRRGEEWVAREARCPTDKHREALHEVFRLAGQRLREARG